MTSVTALRSTSLDLPWRTVEWSGVWIALFLQTGAIFPLLLVDADGGLGEAARAQLRALNLPAYAIAALLLARHSRQLVIALRRNLPLLMLLALPVLSVLWSLSPSITLRRVIGLLGSALLAYLLAIRFTPRQILILLGCLLMPLMLLSIGAIAMHPAADAQMGIFINKNVLGWMSAYATVVGFALAAQQGTPRSGTVRIGGLCLLAAGLLCVLGSQSSTALMSVVAAVAFAGIHKLLRPARGVTRLLLVLLLLQAAALFLSSLHLVIVPVLEWLGKDATLTGRVPLWAEVDKAIAARPLLGYGYQAFWTPVSRDAWRIWATVGWTPPHAHNGYRETLLNVGFLGGAVLAIVVVQGMRQGVRLDIREPDAGWYWLNVLFGMFLITNLTESMILTQNDFFWTMFMTYAVMFALRSPQRDPHRPPKGI